MLGLQGESTLPVGSELLYHMDEFPPNATATVIASPKAMGCSGAHGLITGLVSVKAAASSCQLVFKSLEGSEAEKECFEEDVKC